MEQETLDRVRRIETRVTKIGNHLGVDVGGGKPEWDRVNERVVLPSPNCSISECVKVIPPQFNGRLVNVFVDDEYLTTLCPANL